MKYMGDSNWWNQRFKSRELKIMDHEKALDEDMKYFPKQGKVLDIACGDGRNSIYLASLDYSVKAIDFSEEALSRLQYFAEKQGLSIKTKLVDLSRSDSFINMDKYELIIINHYRLEPKYYRSLMDSLNEKGILWVNGFREVPKDNPNIKESDVFKEEDFQWLHDYEVVNRSLYEIGERKFIRSMWRK